MIKLQKKGRYALFETKRRIRILYLGNISYYAWIHVGKIGDILVKTNGKHIPSSTLSQGQFRIYEVNDEPKLTDLIHLELLVGEGIWQGYLLPTGLPTLKDKKNRIIPTEEVITMSYLGTT